MIFRGRGPFRLGPFRPLAVVVSDASPVQKTASGAFAGVGLLSAAAVLIKTAAAISFIGFGSLTASPVKIKTATAAVAGVGSLSATPSVIRTGTAIFVGRGTLTAIPVRITKDNAGGRRRSATIKSAVLRLPAPILRARTVVLNPARFFLRDRLPLPGSFRGYADAVSPVLLGALVPQVSLRVDLAPPTLVVTAAAWPPLSLEDFMRLGLLDLILDV